MVISSTKGGATANGHATYEALNASKPGQDIAVIGFSCRFGGDAVDNDEFWDLLCKGKDAHTKKSKRFDAPPSDDSPSETEGSDHFFAGHYLKQDPYAFDANFFDVPRKEAKAMDPSQRLMLEVTYEAFENSGLSVNAVRGTNTSCYVGQFVSDYREMVFRDPDSAPTYTVTGTGTTLISNRLSWFFDLHGPSFTLNTACSSSMVALHEACESLRKGESEMSVVGGSNMILSPEMFTYLRNQGFLAPDGRCKTFDETANGYGRGEGVAALVLKPVEEAIRCGDPIRAVIRGTGVNQNGRTKSITLPSAEAQIALIKSTYKSAGLNFSETTYVETHGTGTQVGDRLELEAISQTLAQGRRKKLLIGSSKPNVGHTEATAGLAAIIKGILALESGVIPPNIHFNRANPKIPFDEWLLGVPTELTAWPAESSGLRRMSACSTGYSGTNAHVIIDDSYSYLSRRNATTAIHFTKSTSASRQQQSLKRNGITNGTNGVTTKQQQRLFAIHAHDQEGVKRQGISIANYLNKKKPSSQDDQILLCDLAFTLGNKRSQMLWRSYAVASSSVELQNLLTTTDPELQLQPKKRIQNPPRICFVFTGQGAQWAQMGMGLYHRYPVFRRSIDAADAYLSSALKSPWSATQELFRDAEGSAKSGPSRINDPLFSQTLCTVLQVALVDLLATWGIKPRYIVGHSSGEIAGAYCRGALSQEDAWKVAYFRGFLSSSLLDKFPNLNGAMMAAGVSEAEANDLIVEASQDSSAVGGNAVVVACINSPSSVTLSGDGDAIDELQVRLEKKGKFARRLKVKNAYHSPHMELIASEYVYAIADIKPGYKDDDEEEKHSPKMFSAVTGDLIDPWELGATSWMKNLVSPVRYLEAVTTMLETTSGKSSDVYEEDGAVDIFLEVGPHAALQGPTKQIVKGMGGAYAAKKGGIEYTSVLSRGKDAVDTAMAAAGYLYSLGVPVNLSKVNISDVDENKNLKQASLPAGKMLIDLPPYAWNHSQTYNSLSRVEVQYIQQREATDQEQQRKTGSRGLLGNPYPATGEHSHAWRSFLNPAKLPWLRDHEIDGSVLFPFAGFLVLAVEAAQRVAEPGKVVKAFRLRDVAVSAALVVPEDGDNGIEILVELRSNFPASRARVASAVWIEFTISTCLGGEGSEELRENCSGMISLDYEVASGSALELEDELDKKALVRAYENGSDKCHSFQTGDDKESGPELYKFLTALGLRYGPAFAKVTKSIGANSQSVCDIATQPWSTQDGPFTKHQPKVIHPGTLDAMFHAVFAAARYAPEGNLLTGSMVPTFIEEVVISANACVGKDITYTGVASATPHGLSEMTGHVNMLSTVDGSLEPLVLVRGMNLRATNPGNVASAGSLEELRHISTCLDWVSLPEEDAKQKKRSLTEVVLLCAKKRSALTTHLCQQISTELSALGIQTKGILSWDKVTAAKKGSPDPLQGAHCISLVEIDQPGTFASSPSSAQDFAPLQQAILECETLVWISRDDAAGSIIPGLARTVRNEIPSLTFRTLQISSGSLAEDGVNTLAKNIAGLASSSTADNELREENGVIIVPRLTEDDDMNNNVSNIVNDRDTMEDQVLGDAGVDLSVLNPGNLSSLYFRPHASTTKASPLADDELDIQVQASGLNFRDVMVAMGAIPDLTMGFEASGIVSAVGSKAGKRFKVGDRVVSFGHGGHCTVLRNKEALTQHIPDEMSFETASTLPLVLVTAYNALVRVARAKAGQSVLIHAAAGGVGQAAIQIAQHIGMDIYATVGSEDKRSLLRDTFGLTDDHIFSSRDTSFGRAVRRITGGRGVDVVLNSLAGESLRESWYCVAPFGTFVEIGLKDIQNNSGLDMRPFMQDATFSFFNLSRMIKEQIEVVRELLDETFGLIRRRILKPIAPLTSFPVSQVEDAFRTMQTGKHRGKIALSWVRDQPVPTLVKFRSKLQLKSDATYVLAGGLGGLGRSLANFLVDSGAKHICFVSRSGAKSAQAKKLLTDLHQRPEGVNAWVHQCDLADYKSLEPLADKAARQHHAPIGGVIQCAMVLQDILFEKMTHEQWATSLRPKVQGSANLDRLLSTDKHNKDADPFLIMLSSFAGIFGNLTQGNYAAACAFQDALAHDRRARGHNASVSIDLGIMRDVGYLAENGAAAHGYLHDWEQPFGIRETELHALIHLAIAGETSAQVVTGFATGGTAAKAAAETGIDLPFYFNENNPKFSILAQTGLDGEEKSQGGQKASSKSNLQDVIAKSDTKETALNHILDALRARAAKLLQMTLDDIDIGRPLHAHGVDSLVAVEIRTWLFQDLKANVSTFDLTATVPIKALAHKILSKCELVSEELRK